jgi:hypothetical protein
MGNNSMADWRVIEGALQHPKDFRQRGLPQGSNPLRADLALIYSDCEAIAAESSPPATWRRLR